jgi:hypothetical protein
LKIFEEVGGKGYGPAQKMAGFMHETGLGFSKGFFRNSSSIDWGKVYFIFIHILF